MIRTKVSKDDLLKWLNARLAENEDFQNCSFTSIMRLAEEDKNGCNWSGANVRCSGVPATVCEPEAMRIVTEAKERFNLI